MYTILAPVYLRPPSKNEEQKEVSLEVLELWNMPNAMRAIDRKRVAMVSTKYWFTINRKAFFC